MSRKLLCLFLVIAMLAVVSVPVYATPVNMPVNMSARLTKPIATIDSMGQGQAIFMLDKDGTSVIFRLNVANIDNVSMAHIHVSTVAGGDGPPVVWLYPSAPPAMLIPDRFQGTLAKGTFTAASFIGPLAGMPMSALLMAVNEGRAYVNVHTTAYPGGEIRGQIKCLNIHLQP